MSTEAYTYTHKNQCKIFNEYAKFQSVLKASCTHCSFHFFFDLPLKLYFYF